MEEETPQDNEEKNINNEGSEKEKKKKKKKKKSISIKSIMIQNLEMKVKKQLLKRINQCLKI